MTRHARRASVTKTRVFATRWGLWDALIGLSAAMETAVAVRASMARCLIPAAHQLPAVATVCSYATPMPATCAVTQASPVYILLAATMTNVRRGRCRSDVTRASAAIGAMEDA